MAANDSGANQNEQTSTAVHSEESEIDKSTTKAILSVLNTMQESMNSSNSLLRELLQKKCKSTSSPQTDSAAKRKKIDPNESSQAVKSTSEKAKPTTSHEVHYSGSDEAHDSASDEVNVKTQDDDALSLFGDD